MKYEHMKYLFAFLKMPNNPSKHWNDYVGWEIIGSLHHVASITTKETILSSIFFLIYVYEVTIVNNWSWISIHCNVVVILLTRVFGWKQYYCKHQSYHFFYSNDVCGVSFKIKLLSILCV